MASAKVDDRGLGSKRSRSEGFRRDGDWTCPQCGNVNFSFRTACNRGSCGAACPSASPGPRTGPVPYLGSFDRPLPSYYGGMGVPPPMPFGVSGRYGSPLPPFHGMHYDYGSPSGAPGPYSLMSPYGPSGPLRGYGYGPGPIMDRYGGPTMDRYGGPNMDRYGYGYGYRGSPMPVPDSTSGELLDNSASRKRRGGPDGLFEGDWVCPKCENVNFAFRTTCNMKKCGAPRPASASNRTSGKDKTDAPEGSWTCDKCNNLNYPFRNTCNRKGCGSEKPSSSK